MYNEKRLGKKNMVNILVIDAQGGGLGKQLISSIKEEIEDVKIIAVGTNSVATSAMLKAGADIAATGENCVVVNAPRADIIVGPIGIVIANAMYGEVTPTMATAIASSPAKKVFIPYNQYEIYIVGVEENSIKNLVAEAIKKLKELVQAR